jgi:hypothetical protein
VVNAIDPRIVLFGRLTLILVIGMLAAQFTSLWLHMDERAMLLRQGHAHDRRRADPLLDAPGTDALGRDRRRADRGATGDAADPATWPRRPKPSAITSNRRRWQNPGRLKRAAPPRPSTACRSASSA